MSVIDGYGEFERQILSCSLQGEDLTNFVSLPADAWSTKENLNIHQAVCASFLEGGSVDEISVFEKLKSAGHKHTSLDDLFNLTGNWTAFGQLTRLCNKLEEQANHRRVISTVQQAVDLARQAPGATEAQSTAIGKIISLGDVSTSKHIFKLKDGLKSVIDETKEAFAKPEDEKGVASGITTGFRTLDKILDGFQRGSLYVLGAGTGKGKSVLGLQFGTNAAIAGSKVLYASLEMSHVDLVRRALSAASKVSPGLLKTGTLTSEQIDQVTMGSTYLSRIKESFSILDQPSLTLFQLAAMVRQMKQGDGLDLVIVDYLQLIRTDGTYSREREVATISAGLVAVARTNNIPVVALSQLNQEGSIRESRAVEHDAACVMRIDYGDGEWSEGSEPVNCNLSVVKHRHGRTGRMPLTFERSNQRFVEAIYSY